MNIETFVVRTVEYAVKSLWASRIYLLLGIGLSVVISMLIDQERVTTFLRRAGYLGILVAVALGVLSPLCSCSQVAVLAGLLSAGVPWSTVMPFMISSPMTSPISFGLIAGLLGTGYAVFHTAAVAALGLVSGVIILAGEKLGWLKDQNRLLAQPRRVEAASGDPPSSDGGQPQDLRGSSQDRAKRAQPSKPAPASGCGCGCQGSSGQTRDVTAGAASPDRIRGFLDHLRDRPVARSLYRVGALMLRRTLSIVRVVLVAGLIGGALSQLVPTARLVAYFGSNSTWSVPLAALIGLPLQVDIAHALPIISGMLPLGLSPGAAIAFLMTGPGTCLAALSATWSLAKPRLFALYVVIVVIGATLSGWAFNLSAAR